MLYPLDWSLFSGEQRTPTRQFGMLRPPVAAMGGAGAQPPMPMAPPMMAAPGMTAPPPTGAPQPIAPPMPFQQPQMPPQMPPQGMPPQAAPVRQGPPIMQPPGPQPNQAALGAANPMARFQRPGGPYGMPLQMMSGTSSVPQLPWRRF